MHLNLNDVNRIKEGDHETFKIFFESFYPKMMALACRFVEEEVAKDLVHDSFTTYWEQKKRIDVQNLQSFLYKCLQNECLNYLKHQGIVEQYEAKMRIAEARIEFICNRTDNNDILKQVQEKDLREIIEAAISKLPPRTAEAFRLCYYHDLSHKEIATVMDISTRTVEAHIRQGVLLLRKELKDISLLLAAFTLFQ